MARTAALAFAAVIFYVPANAFPFMMVTNFHHPHAYTILGGVREFINAGMWPLALLVFTASVAVPLIKLLSLGMMMLCTRRTSPAPLKWMTYLYRFVEFIGRWSMIDVFMLSILVGLIHFGEFSRITPAPGALYFAAVVVLTIFAVDSFDPRLMWDAANKNKARHDR
jgi:paraquat-inducible protein A